MIEPTWQSEDGSIRLHCGDCASVLQVLEIGAFGAVIADPPYGVNHKPGSNRFSKICGGIANDVVPPDVRWMARYPAVIWGGNNFCDQLPRSAGWLVWDKTHSETCRHSQAELAWSNVVNTVRWHRQAYHGFMRQRDGWFHQHQKPIELMAWCIGFTEAETILDPFMGSGTTGVACVRTGRKFIGIEIDKGYFDIAVKRIEAAIREREGMLIPA